MAVLLRLIRFVGRQIGRGISQGLRGRRDSRRRPRPDEEMELVEHLEELRWRIIRSLIYIALGTVFAWFFYDKIFALLIAPFQSAIKGKSVILRYDTFTAPFFLQLQVSVIAGLLIAAPFVLAELWGFISPGLLPHEKRPFKMVFPLAVFLFVLGVVLSYYILPAGIQWFLSYAQPGVQIQQDLGRYLLFTVKMCGAFGLGFELPVVLMGLAKIGIINSRVMKTYWRQAVVIIMLVAAILTPSNDPFSMLILSTPMAFLYLASITLVRWVEPKEERLREEESASQGIASAEASSEDQPFEETSHAL